MSSVFKIPSSPVESKIHTVGDLVSIVFQYAIPLAGLLMLAMIIYGGYHLMISAGNPEGIREGKSKILMGIVGFLLVFLSWFVVRVIETIFGINILGR